METDAFITEYTALLARAGIMLPTEHSDAPWNLGIYHGHPPRVAEMFVFRAGCGR
jgi:hypothetical protein